MFYYLKGAVRFLYPDFAVVDVNGAGYKMTISKNTHAALSPYYGKEATLFSYMAVREDAVELFGFYDNEELAYFRMLISVSGVGPKAAVAILSVLTPDMLALSITAGDVKSITKAQGVGPKIAQRIVIELKDKVSKLVPQRVSTEKFNEAVAPCCNGNCEEAVSALVALGYTSAEASKAMASLDMTQSVEDLIKQALRNLARR